VSPDLPSWSALFACAADHDVTEVRVREALAGRRAEQAQDRDEDSAMGNRELPAIDVDPMARVVADADVLAADLFLDGPSRAALDLVRAHSWIRLVASDPLLADAEAVVADLAGTDLAAAWRARIDDLAALVDHPAGDHPALASALHGDTRHLLSLDERLQSVDAGTAIRREANVETSVRNPDAFARLFDPAGVYEAIHGDAYPGPDRDDRRT